jgi:membrane protein involved in colicin uptake
MKSFLIFSLSIGLAVGTAAASVAPGFNSEASQAKAEAAADKAQARIDAAVAKAEASAAKAQARIDAAAAKAAQAEAAAEKAQAQADAALRRAQARETIHQSIDGSELRDMQTRPPGGGGGSKMGDKPFDGAN